MATGKKEGYDFPQNSDFFQRFPNDPSSDVLFYQVY